MELGNYFVYFIVIILLNNKESNAHIIMKQIVAILMMALCFYHFVNDNIAYQQLSMAYQRTSFELAEVLMEIDKVQTTEKELAVLGTFPDSNTLVVTNPAIQGASTKNILISPNHIGQLAKYYYGRDYSLCNNEMLDTIENSAEFIEMPEFPYSGFVKTIDGIIVVKLAQ